MFGISWEHILLFVVVLFIFGPRHLPQMGSTLGKTIRNFKESFKGTVKDAEFRKLGEKDEA